MKHGHGDVMSPMRRISCTREDQAGVSHQLGRLSPQAKRAVGEGYPRVVERLRREGLPQERGGRIVIHAIAQACTHGTREHTEHARTHTGNAQKQERAVLLKSPLMAKLTSRWGCQPRSIAKTYTISCEPLPFLLIPNVCACACAVVRVPCYPRHAHVLESSLRGGAVVYAPGP